LDGIKVGVFGGTFNPVHRGHLHVAQGVQSLFGLSRVYFVVAATPPHKRPDEVTPLAHRYAMVCLATAREVSFVPSLAELEPEPSPYTIDTMKKMERLVPAGKGAGGADAPAASRLFFIAGGDSLLEVSSWREGGRLLDGYNFVFVARPGATPMAFEKCLPAGVLGRVRDLTGLDRKRARSKIAAEPAGESRIYLVDAQAPDISATKIRELAAAKGGDRAMRKMLSPAVRDYIRKTNLYGGG
jgi:nicotinate-nucleotide adenylyltransferase